MNRILLVEDDPVARIIAEDALRADGYQVDVAERLLTAYRLLDTRLYQLVVADVRLGDGNGIDVADAAASKGIATLIVTGHAAEFQSRLDHHEVLAKPVDPDALLAAARRRIAAGAPR
jgi:DNA-binding response OmpR family regulator